MALSIAKKNSFSFRPIYYFSRLFGFFPFSIVYDTNGEILRSKVRVIDGVLFAALIFLHFASASYYHMRPSMRSPIPHVFGIANKITYQMIHYHNVIIITMNMYNRQKIINIIKSFNIIDKKVTTILMHFLVFAKIHCCLLLFYLDDVQCTILHRIPISTFFVHLRGNCDSIKFFNCYVFMVFIILFKILNS